MGFGLICRLGQVGRKVDTKQLGSPVGGGGFWRSWVGAEEEEPHRKHLQHWREERMERGKAGWVGMGKGKCGSPPELEQIFTARGHEEMNGEARRAGWESAPGRTGKKDALFAFKGVHK